MGGNFIEPIFEFIRSDGYVQASKILNLALGVQESVLYGELVSKYAYFSERGVLTTDGFFYCTSDNIYLDTGLTEKMQRTAIRNLKKFGLIDCQLRGIPAKRFFRVFVDKTVIEKIVRIAQEKRQKVYNSTSLPKRSKLVLPQSQQIRKDNNLEEPVDPELMAHLARAIAFHNEAKRQAKDPRKEIPDVPIYGG